MKTPVWAIKLWTFVRATIANPKIVLPVVGAVAFVAQRDKEFSTGQLIAIGIGVAPWLLKFVKSMELFGQKLDFHPQTPEETRASIENRMLEAEPAEIVAEANDANLQVVPAPIPAPAPNNDPAQMTLSDWLASERAALSKLALIYGGHVKSEVKVAGMAWDGLIMTASGNVLVEIKHVRRGEGGSVASNLKIKLVQMIRSRRSGLADSGVKVPSIAVAIIVHDPVNMGRLSELREAGAFVAEQTGASVWVWRTSELVTA
jgi:hypothetical protein